MLHYHFLNSTYGANFSPWGEIKAPQCMNLRREQKSSSRFDDLKFQPKLFSMLEDLSPLKEEFYAGADNFDLTDCRQNYRRLLQWNRRENWRSHGFMRRCLKVLEDNFVLFPSFSNRKTAFQQNMFYIIIRNPEITTSHTIFQNEDKNIYL